MNNLGQVILKHTVINPIANCEKYRHKTLWANCLIHADGSVSVWYCKNEPKKLGVKEGESRVVMSPGSGRKNGEWKFRQ